MPRPETREDLQRFLSVLTYLGKFIPDLSHIASPLQALLEKDIEWQWNAEQQRSFISLKELITKAPVLKYFNPKRPVKLSVDASLKGLGAVLLQDNHPIAYASKALTTCQQNYAQIEKEMLAIVYGCNKFHHYIYGMSTIEVETDHKPLESILRKSLYQAPTRLQKMIMYPINLVYRPGKQLVIADTLSRSYIKDSTDSFTSFEFEVNTLTTVPILVDKLHLLQTQTHFDPALQCLMKLCTDGWPNNRSKVPAQCLPFWIFRDQISFTDGILFKIIIPIAMQPEKLKFIHSSHLDIEKCKRRARDVLYWPGMSSQIENLISFCTTCATH